MNYNKEKQQDIYLSMFNVKNIDDLTYGQFKKYVSLRYGADEVFRFGTEDEIKELIAICREAIKQDRNVYVGMILKESCNGEMIDEGRNFIFEMR